MTQAEELIALLDKILEDDPSSINDFRFSNLNKPDHFLFEFRMPKGDGILLIKDPEYLGIQVFEGESIMPSAIEMNTKGLGELLDKLIARHPKATPF